ncbi:cupin-like domain-containing protein [Gilvimarinus japonicus]|jgi:hypothetical protein|uniref:Cupin-like domain-containing protein n=1 Tax=Gilvimarinus japonicus TaxID=1796469 RepID=A0ABV7HLY9_9GAMM
MKPITSRKTKQIEGVTPNTIPFDELVDAGEPVILKGTVKNWGLVQAGQTSCTDGIDYLKSYYGGRPVGAYYGAPEVSGRYFYTNDVSALNFEKRRVALDEFLDTVEEHLVDERPPSLYVGSSDIDLCLPGMREDNSLGLNHPMFEFRRPFYSIWLGNPSVISAHYDVPNNLACCCLGKRRFTLFPPEQIDNLYPGPLEPTPGGQPISMVDFANPDFNCHPRAKWAIDSAQVADLEPGDVLFYPSMWWHQVESFSPFNAMINYWWDTTPDYMGTPTSVLMHALLSIRGRPEQERQAWKHIFDYYVFGSTENSVEHLPEHAWGDLGALDGMKARKLRAYLLNRLNR